MKKFLWIVLVGICIWAIQFPIGAVMEIHPYYDWAVLFFLFQNFLLFRIESFSNPDLKVQIRMVNIGVRMISAMAFIVVMFWVFGVQEKLFYIQFIILYLTFMTFEIILALANLRRN